MSYAGLLTRIPLFAGLTAEEVDRLQGLTTEAGFPAGRNVVTVGEPGDSLYIVVSGSVQILYPGLNQDFELARLGPGDFFGEMALLNDEPRSATVHTLEPTTTLMLAKDDFRQVVQSSSGLAFRLLEVLSRRIRSADAQMGGLSEQALKDPLTGLLNRRAFHERLAEEGDRARRYGDQFSLILMDVDQFKLVNDSLGHDVGDEVLKWLGRILTEHTRAADAPFRVGGEEFAILAPAAGPEVARAVGNRIRATIAESRPPVGSELKLTVSGGYVTCPDHGRDPNSLYRLADQALLRAKDQGRNCIADPEIPDEPPPSSG